MTAPLAFNPRVLHPSGCLSRLSILDLSACTWLPMSLVDPYMRQDSRTMTKRTSARVAPWRPYHSNHLPNPPSCAFIHEPAPACRTFVTGHMEPEVAPALADIEKVLRSSTAQEALQKRMWAPHTTPLCIWPQTHSTAVYDHCSARIVKALCALFDVAGFFNC